MTQQPDTIEGLLALRRLTRATAELLRERVKGYLATLTPLFRPRLVFGDYVQGITKDTAKSPDDAFKELVALHDRMAVAKPFGLRTQLAAPINIASSTLEISALEYSHDAVRDGDRRPIAVRSPLKWILSYSGFSPVRLREILSERNRSAEELHQFLVHYLVLHIVTARQTGVTAILGDLGFRVSAETLEEFGDLPVTCVAAAVSTRRPSDDIIIRSAELSGMDAFEEVVRLQDVSGLRDPLKDALVDLVSAHGLAMPQ